MDTDSLLARETFPADESLTNLTQTTEQRTFDTDKQAEEKLSVENLVAIAREIPTTLSTRSLRLEESTDVQPSHTSTIIQQSTEKNEPEQSQPIFAQEIGESTTSTTTEETQAEPKGAVHDSSVDTTFETFTTPVSAQQPSHDLTIESTSLPDRETQKSSVDSTALSASIPFTLTEDQVEKSTDTDRASAHETIETTSTFQTKEETATDDTSQGIEVESLSYEASQLPSTDTTTDKTTTRVEDQVPSTEAQVQEQPTDIKEDQTLKSTETASTTETVEGDVSSSETSIEAAPSPSIDTTTTKTTSRVEDQTSSTESQAQEQPKDIKEEEILRSTEITSTTQTVEDKPKEFESDVSSSETLTKAIPSPLIDVTTDKTTAGAEEQVEQPGIESTVSDLQQVSSTEVKSQVQPTDIKEDEALESTKTTSTTETVDSEVSSSEPLNKAVPSPLIDVTTDKTTTGAEDQVEQPSIDSTDSDLQQASSTEVETQEQPTHIKEDEAPESIKTTPTTETGEERPIEVDSEVSSSEALTKAIPSPLIDTTAENATTGAEEQVEQPDIESTVSDLQQVSSTEVKSQVQPMDIKEDEALKSTKTISTTETVEEEHLPTAALAEVIGEIIRTSLTARHLSADVTSGIPESTERSSSDTVDETTFQTAVVPETATTEEKTATTIDQSVDIKPEETQVREESTSDFLTETVHLPSIESQETKTIDRTEEQTEQPSAETSTLHTVETVITEEKYEEPIEIKEEEVSTLNKSSPVIETIEDATNEVDLQRPSPTTLTEVVREPLVTPSTETKMESTPPTIPSEAAEKDTLTSDQLSNVGKTDEEGTSTTDTLALMQTSATDTTVTDDTSAEEPEFFDTVEEKKEEPETLPTDSLTKTVSEILAGTLSFRRPSTEQIEVSQTLAEQKEEKPSGSIFGSIVQQIKDAYHDLTTKSEEPLNEESTTDEESR